MRQGFVIAGTVLSALGFAQVETAKLLEPISFRSIGPSGFGGRVLDIEADPRRLNTIYIGSADGGIFKTVNNGVTWTPITDGQTPGSTGDIAIAPSNPDIIWYGTGENTSTRSAHYGDGVYKSTDGGQTWKNMGLPESKRIGQIAIDPKNPDVVYVAAMGYLYKEGGEKGIYKTTDGGKTWTQVLKGDNGNTGFIDVKIDPHNSKVVYAASHDRLRRAWNIRENGPGAAIYKSTDAGKTWTKLGGGLPTGDGIGRIGLAIYPKDSKLVYAFIDNKTGGGQVWRSMDAGKTWAQPGTARLSGGTYYSRIFVDPSNPDVIYCPNVNMMRSKDGGKTFQSAVGPRAHVDWHTVWINPNDPDHVRIGCDGGLYFSYDGLATVMRTDNLPISQFYQVAVDNALPYNIMGGTQDNGSWRGPSLTTTRGGIFNWNWRNLLGGDGFYNVPHPEEPDTVYSSSQFGGVNRVDVANNLGRSIRPRDTGQRANWMAPFFVSPYAADTIYWGGNKLYKSLNRGDDWRAISPDLTTNDANKTKGNVPHCTITTLDESREKQGVLWVGTDDGNVWVTENDGNSWTQVNSNMTGMPANYWVSRVHASPHDANTAWVSYTGFREDDWTPYVWKTTDLGKTWTRVEGLPNEQVSVIKQDAINPELLYVGTEQSLQMSLDGGKTWSKVGGGLPQVPVQDLVIQERESDLVLGTHGRGFWIADVTPYRQMTEDVMDKPAFLFKPTRGLTYNYVSDMFEPYQGWQRYAGQNPNYGANIWYYLKSEAADAPKIEIVDIRGTVLATLTGGKSAGLNKVVWNMRSGPRSLTGEFMVRMTVGADVQTQTLAVQSIGRLGEQAQGSFDPDQGDDEEREEALEKMRWTLESIFQRIGLVIR